MIHTDIFWSAFWAPCMTHTVACLDLDPDVCCHTLHMPTGQSPIASPQSQEYGIYSWDVEILDWKNMLFFPALLTNFVNGIFQEVPSKVT